MNQTCSQGGPNDPLAGRYLGNDDMTTEAGLHLPSAFTGSGGSKSASWKKLLYVLSRAPGCVRCAYGDFSTTGEFVRRIVVDER